MTAAAGGGAVATTKAAGCAGLTVGSKILVGTAVAAVLVGGGVIGAWKAGAFNASSDTGFVGYTRMTFEAPVTPTRLAVPFFISRFSSAFSASSSSPTTATKTSSMRGASISPATTAPSSAQATKQGPTTVATTATPGNIKATTSSDSNHPSAKISMGSYGVFMNNAMSGDNMLTWGTTGNDDGVPGIVRKDTPTTLEGIIVYAYVSEQINSSFTGCLGNTQHFKFCPPGGGDCCMNSIIYENPGCCRNGYTPSYDSLLTNQCTFDAFEGAQCQADCDLDPTNDQVRDGCKNWYGTAGGPKATTFIDFAQNSSVVNAKLGAVVLPFLRTTFLPWVNAGGKFRAVSIDWGHNGMGSVKNWRFKGPDMNITQNFQFALNSFSEFDPSEYLTMSTSGSTVRFCLEYSIEDLIYVFDFSGATGLSADPDAADNCFHNTTSGYHHCLNVNQLGKTFIPHATLETAVQALYQD